MPATWQDFLTTLTTLGVLRGLFVVFFVGAHLYIRWLYGQNMQAKQDEINRLVEENKEHRHRFQALIEKQLNIPKSRLPAEAKRPPRLKGK